MRSDPQKARRVRSSRKWALPRRDKRPDTREPNFLKQKIRDLFGRLARTMSPEPENGTADLELEPQDHKTLTEPTSDVTVNTPVSDPASDLPASDLPASDLSASDAISLPVSDASVSTHVSNTHVSDTHVSEPDHAVSTAPNEPPPEIPPEPPGRFAKHLASFPVFNCLQAFFSKQATVASPTFNRWLVALPALAVHLSIGQVYAFSVFNKPLSMLIGITQPAPGDWARTQISWIFSTSIVMLGLSAFIFGRWIEKVGPRLAMFVAACCFGGGLLISAAGIRNHDIGVIYFGYGFLGGIGLGLGYLSPVSTLIRWFPDRPGMATGIAIMGFGGGAALASPLSVALMDHFRTATDLGVEGTFLTLGTVYLCLMMLGMLTIRVPPPNYTRPASSKRKAAGSDVHVDEALRTPQFWLLWWVLLLNVTAGIGILAEASPMIQEIFPATVDADYAAAFVVLLSVSNMIGRFAWSALSDVIGRQYTYGTFFFLGAILYVSEPSAGHLSHPGLFVFLALVIVSMYGGGFATLPAYIRDQFGTMHVASIHGRLLTAWSVAGVAGPTLVVYIRQQQLANGVPKSESYYLVMYILVGIQCVGLLCNLLIRPVASTHHFPRVPVPLHVSARDALKRCRRKGQGALSERLLTDEKAPV